jgi:hypothetical protein
MVSALLGCGVALQLFGCGKASHPPPPDPAQPDFFKERCVCSIPWSPAAAQVLGLAPSANPSVVDVDACLTTSDLATATTTAATYCQNDVRNYVQGEVEDILRAKSSTGFGNLACTDGAAIQGGVTCSLQAFPNQPTTDSTGQFVASGVKKDPKCSKGPSPSVNTCMFEAGGNCNVSLDPVAWYSPTNCQCNTVAGCDNQPRTIIRTPVGNADDPPATAPDDSQSPANDVVFGRHEGTIDPSHSRLDATASGDFCVDLLLGSVCKNVSDSESSAISGGFSVYGHPCPGNSCPVFLELNLAAGDLHFELSLLGFTVASRTVNNILVFAGTGDAPITVDANGHGVVPANVFQFRAFANDGDVEQVIDNASVPVEFFIDWNAHTLRFPAFPLSFDGVSTTIALQGSFGSSLLESTSGLCPKPVFAPTNPGLATSCNVGGALKFAAPDLKTACTDTPAKITGRIEAVNGTTLSSPIPIVNGIASAPRGTLQVRWTATDTQGRTDSVVQTVNAVTSPTIFTTDTLDVRDRAFVQEASGSFASVANSGLSSTIGTDASVGELDTNAAAQLRDRAKVTGLLISPAQPVLSSQASYGSWQKQTPSFVSFPSLPPHVASTAVVYVAPDTTQPLAPGAYGAVTIQPRGKLLLTAGDYSFTSFDFESTAHLVIDTSHGPVRITTGAVTLFRGTFDMTVAQSKLFTFGYTGTAPLYIESAFEGTLVAPSAEVTLRAINQASHYGQFFARTLHVDAGAKVVHNVLDCE